MKTHQHSISRILSTSTATTASSASIEEKNDVQIISSYIASRAHSRRVKSDRAAVALAQPAENYRRSSSLLVKARNPLIITFPAKDCT